MIFKAVNHRDIHINGNLKTIEDKKAAIHRKYGIPVEKQHIIFNGRFHVLGIFENPLLCTETINNNPLAVFGCPNALFEQMSKDGMSVEEIESTLHPRNKEEDIEIGSSWSINSNEIAESILSGEYSSLEKRLGDIGQRTQILKNMTSYVDFVMKEFNDLRKNSELNM